MKYHELLKTKPIRRNQVVRVDDGAYSGDYEYNTQAGGWVRIDPKKSEKSGKMGPTQSQPGKPQGVTAGGKTKISEKSPPPPPKPAAPPMTVPP